MGHIQKATVVPTVETEWLQCPKCKGKRKIKTIIGEVVACYECDGVGKMPSIDVDAIADALKGRQGNALRTSPPFGSKRDTLMQRRCYYVWRMARYHGGADTTMPLVAMLSTEHDPFRKHLDVLADVMAIRQFGSDKLAAKRWQAAGLF